MTLVTKEKFSSQTDYVFDSLKPCLAPSTSTSTTSNTLFSKLAHNPDSQLETSITKSRTVTIQSSQDFEPLSDHSSISTSSSGIVIAASKKKKKKKKPQKKDALVQAPVIDHLGSSFALPSLPPPALKKTTSLLEAAYCPKFNEKEIELLKGMLDKSAFCENINLMDVFLSDFFAMQEMIKKELKISHSSNFDNAPDWFENQDITFELYFLYLYMHGKVENLELGIDVAGNYDKALFKTIPEGVEYLSFYRTELLTILNNIEDFQKCRTAGKSKKVLEVYEKRFKNTVRLLTNFKEKIQLLSKCLQSEDAVSLLIVKKTSEWSESHPASGCLDLPDRLTKVKEFHTFVKNFLIRGARERIISYVAEGFLDYLNLMEQTMMNHIGINHIGINHIGMGHFNKRSIATFISEYKRYSCNVMNIQFELYTALMQSQNDRSYNYLRLKEKEVKNSSCENHSREKSLSFLTQKFASFDITDKWINDINQTMITYFLTDAEKFHITPPQSFIQHLLKLLDLADTFETYPPPMGMEDSLARKPAEDDVVVDLNDQTKSLTDDMRQWMKSLNDKIEILTFEAESELKEIYKLVSFAKIKANLDCKFKAPCFRLSRCLVSLNPIGGITRDFSYHPINKILKELLNFVRQANKDGQLDNFDKGILKKEIQELLFHKSFRISTYIMIAADVRSLISKSRADGVLHLLPDELFNFLNLKGFDEIFSTPQPTTLLNLKTQEEAEPCRNAEPAKGKEKKVNSLAQTVIHPEQSISLQTLLNKNTLPTKEDFDAAHKKRILDRLFQRINKLTNDKLECVRITGSHHIYSNSRANVIVPLDLEDKGTRKAIFSQVCQALPEEYKL